MPDRATPALDSLDIPDWERRADVRRTDDRTLLAKCRTLARELGAVVGVAAALLAIVAFLAGLLGVRLQGPPQTMAAIMTRQDSLALRVGRLEAGAQETHEQLGGLTTDVRFLSYLLCVKDGGRDPVALNRCQDILQSVRHPQ